MDVSSLSGDNTTILYQQILGVDRLSPRAVVARTIDRSEGEGCGDTRLASLELVV